MSKAKRKAARDKDVIGAMMLVGLIVLIGVVGLLFTQATTDVILIKSVVFSWLVTVMFLVLLGEYAFKGEVLIPRSKVMIPLGVFVLLSVLSAVSSPYKHAGVKELAAATCCWMLVLVAVRGVADKSSLLYVAGALAIVGAASCLYGVFQHRGMDPIFGTNVPWPEKGRSFAGMGHPNFFASFLILTLPILLSLFFWVGNGCAKGLLIVLISVMVLCLLYTQSRGAWLGYVLVLPIWLFFSLGNRRLRVVLVGPMVFAIAGMFWALLSGKAGGLVVLWALPFWLAAVLVLQYASGSQSNALLGGKPVWTAALLVAVSVVLWSFADRQQVVGRVEESFEAEKGSVRTRRILWTGARNMFRAKPVLGWGTGTFGVYFPRFRDPATAGKIAPNTLHAHSEYLEVATEMGVVGLAVFLWMLVAFAWEGSCRAMRSRSRWQGLMLGGLLAGCAAILIQATVSVTTRWVVGRFFLWLGIGLAIATGNMKEPTEAEPGERKKRKKEEEGRPGTYRFQIRSVRSPKIRLGFALMGVGVVVLAGIVGGRVIRSAVLTRRAQSYQEAAETVVGRTVDPESILGARLRQGRLRKEAINLYEKAIELNRYNLSAYYSLGHCYNLERDFENALKTYRRMQKLAPDGSDVHYNLGVVYANMRRWEESRDELMKALSMKIGPLTRLALARAYANLRLFDKAEEQYNSFMEERPGDIRGLNSLASLYVRQGKNAKAADLYGKALEIDPTDADARLGVGLLYQVLAARERAEGNMERALSHSNRSIADLEVAVRSRPDSVPSRAALAMVYGEVGRFDEAQAQLRMALKLQPRDPLAYLNLGRVHLLKGDVKQAVEAFRKTIEVDEGGPWGREAARELRRMGSE